MNARNLTYGLLIVCLMSALAMATETETFSFSISTSMAGSATTGVSFDVTTVATRSAGTGSITCGISYDTSSFELSGNSTQGPYSLSSSATSQTITWTMTGNNSGTYSIDTECHGSGATASDTDSITVTNPPDISLTLTPNPSTIPSGQNFTAVLRIQNNGGAVTNPAAVLGLSLGLSLASGSLTQNPSVGALNEVSINWTVRGTSAGTRTINVAFTGDNSATKTASSSVVVSSGGLSTSFYCENNGWCESGCCLNNFCEPSSSCSTTTTSSVTTTTQAGGGSNPVNYYTTIKKSGGGTAPTANMTATCFDGIRNQNETDVDCGGKCNPCLSNKSCSKNSDCISNYCNTASLRCEEQSTTTTVQALASTTMAPPTTTTQEPPTTTTVPVPKQPETTTTQAPVQKATCDDLIKNCHDGSCEDGVDCGGPCSKECPSGLPWIWVAGGVAVVLVLVIAGLAILRKGKMGGGENVPIKNRGLSAL